MIAKNILKILLLLMPIANAQAEFDCGLDSLDVKGRYNIEGSGYWMQAAGDCRITYTSYAGVYSKMYNMCTRKQEDITNDLDAFPVPGGDFELYVHPVNGISFYSVENLQKGQKEPIYNDRKLYGNYQSLGLLPGSTPDKKIVRISMGNKGGTLRDYEITKVQMRAMETDPQGIIGGVQSDGGVRIEIKPVQGKAVEICRNLNQDGLDKELPMISRDGQMIAGRDGESRKQKIYKIKMPSGDCEELAEIPAVTSKVNFSFDNKSVYYVVDDPQSGNGRLMKLDIASGNTQTISAPNEDVKYSASHPDGTLLYTRGKSLFSLGSELVKLDKAYTSAPANARPYEVLGALWSMKCNSNIDMDSARVVGYRLKEENCMELANSADEAILQGVGVKKEDLTSACKKSQSSSGGSDQNKATK